MDGLTVQQLECFLAAARELHFTRAAEGLGMAQPTLSLIIRELERRVGVPLFDRVGRTVRLTEAGTVFREHAQVVMEDLGRAQQAVADLGGMTRGRVRVAATHILATALLPGVVAKFHRAHPGVRLEVRKLPSRMVEEQLLAGELEVGITFDPAESAELLATRLFEERIVLAVPRGHAWAKRKRVRFAELATLPLAVTTPDFATRRLLESTAAAAGIRLQVAMEFNDIDLLLATVAEGGAEVGGGVATMLARRAIGAKGRGLALVNVVEPQLTRTAVMLWHRDRYRTAAARELGRMIEAGARRL